MSNLQTYYHFKLDFQKVDQHTGGKISLIDASLKIFHLALPPHFPGANEVADMVTPEINDSK